ncbi:hypothetical protein [Yoonia sp. 2307UL14-13]|uniref:hypothetical protein n=1 Tax=Yoonia sp. 2307UL14-13 TaxID=3126506 RepID=UPI0030A4F8A3
MTIALPGSSKSGLSGLLGRKRNDSKLGTTKPAATRKLKPQDVAKLFVQEAAPTVSVRPAKLNDKEKRDQDRLSSLRGALYSKD